GRLPVPHPEYLREGITKLFGRQAPYARPPKNVIRGWAFIETDRGPLVNMGGEKAFEGFLQIIAVSHQVFGEPIEQGRVPSRLFHVIQWLDQPASEQPGP